MYNIVGGAGCIRCKMLKSKLNSLNIHYNYIDTESDYGKELVDTYSIDELPFIFDNEKVYSLQEMMTIDKA